MSKTQILMGRLCTLLAAVAIGVGCEPGVERNQPAASNPELEAGTPESADLAEVDKEQMVPATPLVDAEKPPQPSEPPAATLGIGDPAPALAIAEWSMGKPFGKFENGQVYVVEFWATWCGPCRTSMPHISQLQENYGEKVHFVGITREDAPTVENFLAREQSEGKTWEQVIKYRLALDEGGKTNDAYMRAANQNGIPTAFIVGKDGIVEWIGHPMSIDEPLEEIVQGDWDRDAAIAAFRANQKMAESRAKLNTLLRGQKWDEALAILEELEQQLGENPSLLMTKTNLLTMAGRNEEASAVRDRVLEVAWDNAMLLNQVAWESAIAPEKSEAQLAQALKAAQRASELTQHADGSILDTLARVFYEQGDLDQAIEWQRKAVEYANGQAAIQKTLDKYLSEKEGQ